MGHSLALGTLSEVNPAAPQCTCDQADSVRGGVNNSLFIHGRQLRLNLPLQGEKPQRKVQRNQLGVPL